MPGVGSYTRETAGPMTWLAAVRALTHREVLWADVCHRYQAGWTASGCANDQHQSMDEASMLLCEAWEYILDAQEPTVFSMQCRRESLLRRILRHLQRDTLGDSYDEDTDGLWQAIMDGTIETRQECHGTSLAAIFAQTKDERLADGFGGVKKQEPAGAAQEAKP